MLSDTRCCHIFTTGALKTKQKNSLQILANVRRLPVIFCYHRHRFSFGSSTLLLLLFVASLYCAPFLAHCFVFVSLLTYFYCCPLFVMFDFTLPAPYFTSAFLIRCLSFPCPPLCLSPFCVCVSCVPCVNGAPLALCVLLNLGISFFFVSSGHYCQNCFGGCEARSNSSEGSLVPLVSKMVPSNIFFHIVFSVSIRL